MAAQLAKTNPEDPDLSASTHWMGGTELLVELIDSPDQIASLQTAWKAIYNKDPESGFFLSWDWISALCDQYSSRLRVLAVRGGDGGDGDGDGNYLGFFPISTRMRWSRSSRKFQTILEPGGRAALSEVTGILCNPDHEEHVVCALAGKIANLPWTRFSMRYEPTGRRSQMLLDALPSDQFSGRFRSYRINDDLIDNLNCPWVSLPASYDEWLTSLSSNTRQKVRRYTRKHLESGAWHVTRANTETLDRDIDIVLDLWTQRWVGEKGTSGARRTTSIYRHMFATAHHMGMLHLPIIWAGDTPLAAHACIADTTRKHVHFVAAGRSVAHDQPNSGLLLHSESIRWAIDGGFSIYDFGHGDEAYKASLGGHNKRLHYLYVERLSADPGEALDPFNLSSGVRKVGSLIAAGKTQDARNACAQLQAMADAHRLPDGPISNLSSKLEARNHG